MLRLVGCSEQGRLFQWKSRPIGGMPSVGVFLRDPSALTYASFGKTMEKCEQLGQQAQPGIELGISRLPVLTHRIVQSLVKPRTDSFNIHSLPGFRT